MSLVIFNQYMSIGKALVTFSALEAGGFHPSYHNYYHAHIAYMQMIAFGGLIIQIPEHEFEDAKAWIIHLQERPELEGDDIPERKFGMWRHTLAMVSFNSPLFVFLPLLLLSVKKVLIAMSILFTVMIAGTVLENMLATISLYVLGLATLYMIGVGLASIWPLETLMSFILLWLAIQWFTGFTPENMIGLVNLLPIFILIHAKHVALPRLQRKRAHVD